MLHFSDLTIGYRLRRRRERIVLRDLCGKADGGSLVGLVGPNGAGKSTLLRTLVGLQPALSGDIWLDGRRVSELSPVEVARTVAVVLTDRVDVGRLKVNELVGLGRQPHTGWYGRLSERDRRIVDECLAETGAEHLAERLLSELSDGQRQRVMVARALAQEPRTLLLDEPTSFLDPPSRIRIFDLLRRLAHIRELTVIVCTHDIEVAARYCDELWLVSADHGMKIGAPEDLALSGALSQVFGRANFDLGTLTFSADSGSLPLAVVYGDGDRAHCARHCLRRAGYAIVPPGQVDEDSALVVRSGTDAWQITSQSESRHTTLSELYRAAVSERMNP